MKLNRLLPLLAPLLVFVLEEIYFFSPKLIYAMAALIILIIFFAIWQLARSSQVDGRWWNYLILPAALAAAVMAYSVFLSNKFLVQLSFVFYAVFLCLYLRYVYYYLLRPAAYQVFSIENLSAYANWLAFFLLAAAVYGLQSFLNSPISLLMLIMLAAAALLAYQIIWANKIELKAGLPFILISCLILVELFWVISFLPFNHNISGLSLAICYYAVIGLVKNHLLDKLEASKVKMYLIVGGASLFLITITAKWM